MVMAVAMVGVIAVAEVITTVGGEATITVGDTIIAAGGDCKICSSSLRGCTAKGWRRKDDQ
jgi:hypothetical protein